MPAQGSPLPWGAGGPHMLNMTNNHALGDAGNTMCSHDGVLRAPLGIAWYGPPYSSRGSKGISPPIIVDGVLVTQFQDYIHHTVAPKFNFTHAGPSLPPAGGDQKVERPS